MSRDLVDVVRKTLGGTVLVFLGNVLGMGAKFVTKLLTAGYLQPSGYGLVVLGYTVVNVLALILLLGLPQGIAQRLPRTERKGEIVRTAVLILLPVVLAVATGVFGFAGPIADVFDEPGLAPVLAVFALGLPSMVFLRLAIGTFRGLEDPVGRVLVQNVSNHLLVLGAIGAGIALGVGPVGIGLGWIAGPVVGSVVGVVLLSRAIDPWSRGNSRTGSVPNGTALDLVKFSVPLMLSGVAAMLLNQVDNLLVGTFRTSAALGVYDAAFTLARTLLLFTESLTFMALPVFSKLLGDGNLDGVDRTYKLTTKWIVVAALPVYLTMVTFPAEFLGLLFGPSYTAGRTALIVVATGFFTHVLAGVNGNALIAASRTRPILYGNGTGLLVNVVLNLALIPRFGIVGAATASFVAYVLMNGYWSYALYAEIGVHPFQRTYFEVLAASGAAFVGLLALSSYLAGGVPSTTVERILFAGVYTVVHLVVVYGTGIDDTDQRLFRRMKRQLLADS